MADKSSSDLGTSREDDAEPSGRPGGVTSVYKSPRRPGLGELAGAARDRRLKRPASKRSGGPRTDEGRALAAQNSLTHGAYATRLPESVELHGYIGQLRSELSPNGLLEETLAAGLAYGAFKAERLREFELARLMRAAGKGIDTRLLASRLEFPWAQSHHELLSSPPNEFELQAAVHRAWVRLARPPAPDALSIGRGRAAKQQALGVEQPQDQRLAELYEEVAELLSRRGLLLYMHEQLLCRLDLVMLEARSGANYLGRRLKGVEDELILVHYWMLRNARVISLCAQELQEEVALEVLCDERLARANTHVSNKIRNDIETLQSVRSLKDTRLESLKARPFSSARAKRPR